MSSKRSHTANVLLLSLAVLTAGHFFKLSKFHINTQTKQSWGYPKDSLLNFTELTAEHGYLSEEHTVQTEDGYLLKIFRMIKGRNCRRLKKQKPVILMHGLLQSSDVWLDAGPEAGLGYLLSDACYDLWVGNQRGNYYGRNHKHLNPDKDSEFWKFSVDEIGFYDVPATISYVLNYTGAEQVSYIGYSQGSSSFYIMCSERPGYCDKVKVLISLAPAARQTNTKSVIYRMVTKTIDNLFNVLAKSGVGEVFPKGALSQEVMAFFCQIPVIANSVCSTLAASFDAGHPGSITNETTRVLYGHFPAGTSLQNMARYGQSMRSRNFEKFDYGLQKNLKVYGSEAPPKYNLSAVTVPVVVIYGRNDHLVDPKDVMWLVRKLPKVLEVKEVKNPLWNHLDVTYSQYTSELIFPTIHEYLNTNTSKELYILFLISDIFIINL